MSGVDETGLLTLKKCKTPMYHFFCHIFGALFQCLQGVTSLGKCAVVSVLMTFLRLGSHKSLLVLFPRYDGSFPLSAVVVARVHRGVVHFGDLFWLICNIHTNIVTYFVSTMQQSTDKSFGRDTANRGTSTKFSFLYCHSITDLSD